MNYNNNKYLNFFINLISFWLLFNVFWIARKFDNPTLDQMIFHIQFGMEEADFDKSLVFSYLIRCCLYPVLLSVFVLVISAKLKNLRDFTLNGFFRTLFFVLPFALVLLSIAIAIHKFNVIAYFKQSPSEDVVAKYYMDPQEVLFKPKNPKNLILIYVESLEKSYSDTTVFNKNLVETLDHQDGVEIENYVQFPGAGWTMGGVVSSQCAIPLKTLGLGDGNNQGKLYKSFLPNATCLGDELKNLGYTNVFLGGASLKFSGKGKFFSGHGYQKIMGRDEWLKSTKYNESDLNGWGLFDKDILNEARNEVDYLHGVGKPFNLTILTVDTHFPNGYLSSNCKTSMLESDSQIESVIQCSASEVSNFIDYVRAKGYLKNTNIVVLGDHLSMGSSLNHKLKKVTSRKIYNKWISGDQIQFNRLKISHFDVAPTILDFIGIHVSEARYGLGYSALSHENIKPSDDFYDDLQANLNNKSKFYNKFWVKDF